jgi:hypothetical protein
MLRAYVDALPAPVAFPPVDLGFAAFHESLHFLQYGYLVYVKREID